MFRGSRLGLLVVVLGEDPLPFIPRAPFARPAAKGRQGAAERSDVESMRLTTAGDQKCGLGPIFKFLAEKAERMPHLFRLRAARLLDWLQGLDCRRGD